MSYQPKSKIMKEIEKLAITLQEAVIPAPIIFDGIEDEGTKSTLFVMWTHHVVKIAHAAAIRAQANAAKQKFGSSPVAQALISEDMLAELEERAAQAEAKLGFGMEEQLMDMMLLAEEKIECQQN